MLVLVGQKSSVGVDRWKCCSNTRENTCKNIIRLEFRQIEDQIVLWPTNHLAIRQPSILPTPQSDIPPTSKEDGVMNYSLQVLQLGFLLIQLNDTEREGDGNRSLLNWKILMLYFRCRSRGMKYAFEAMRFITMTKALYTARMAHRVIHGQFINTRVELATITQMISKWSMLHSMSNHQIFWQNVTQHFRFFISLVDIGTK